MEFNFKLFLNKFIGFKYEILEGDGMVLEIWEFLKLYIKGYFW